MILDRDGANSNTEVFGIVIYNYRQCGKYAVDDVKRDKRHREGSIKAVKPSRLVNKLEYDHQKSQQGKSDTRVQALVIENEDEYGNDNNKV